MKWFDQTDLETPYKALAQVERMADDKKVKIMESVRFAGKDEALAYFHACKGRCIVSHHDYHREKTKIIAYKYK